MYKIGTVVFTFSTVPPILTSLVPDLGIPMSRYETHRPRVRSSGRRSMRNSEVRLLEN